MQWAQRACLASALPVAAALVFWAARRRRRQLGQWQPGQPLADDDWLSPQVTVGSGVNQKSYCHTRPPPIAEPVEPLLSTEPLVVVVGLGGVGSHAAHLLLRGGVRRLRLVDFDQVSLSSLNRHATAVRRDVGTPKARALRDQLLRIAPDAQAPRCPCRAHCAARAGLSRLLSRCAGRGVRLTLQRGGRRPAPRRLARPRNRLHRRPAHQGGAPRLLPRARPPRAVRARRRRQGRPLPATPGAADGGDQRPDRHDDAQEYPQERGRAER